MVRFVKYSIYNTIALAILAGCASLNPALSRAPLTLPSGLSIEEHALKDMPASDSAAFVPLEGTAEEILNKHQAERDQHMPDMSTYENFNPGYWAMLNGQKIVATYYETPDVVTDKGTFFKGYVEVMQGARLLYTVQTGDSTPASSLRGLWTYDNHWVLEVIHATQKTTGVQNEMDFDLLGEIIQDGQSLSQQQQVHETFGFQVMNRKPFYFYEKSGQLGVSYAGNEIPLGYTQIPHYWCCSAAALNPRSAENMVSFFAQRDGTWYYVEIGVFG